METLMSWIAKRPWLAIFPLLITIGFIPGLTRLVIDPSAEGMMAQRSAEKAYYNQIREEFGDDVLISVIVSADNAFRADVLEAVMEIRLYDVEGVTHVVSLATVKKLKNMDGFLDTDQLTDYAPDTPEERQQLKEDALRQEALVNNIVAEDGRTPSTPILPPSTVMRTMTVGSRTQCRRSSSNSKKKFRVLKFTRLASPCSRCG